MGSVNDVQDCLGNLIKHRVQGCLDTVERGHRPGVRGRLQNSVAMAETAYLLIALDRSTPAAVAREIVRVPGIVEASVTMGDFDVIAVVQQEDTKEFPVVAAAVQRVEGVHTVVTCVVVTP